ncbi:MAG: hypothetical protein M1818_003527 [Claussenomyces sp. TS43310]|nr:MAG: hypothetical protein M1818_003527 [Claussenomyces sp. TS43310]
MASTTTTTVIVAEMLDLDGRISSSSAHGTAPAKAVVVASRPHGERADSMEQAGAEGRGHEVAPTQPEMGALEVREGDSGPEEDIVYPTGIKFAVVMLALGLALVLVGLDFSILATAVPSITTHFQTITDVGWYYSAYRLSLCAFQFMFGKIYSVFSIKTVFLIALVIFEIGSFVSGIAPTSAAVVVGRAISGFGSAGIISGIFTMATQIAPLQRRPMFTGFAAGIEGIASAGGPLIGGLLTDRLSWRWCFYINIPLGVATFVVVAVFSQNPRVNPDAALPFREKLRRLDLLSTLVFVPAIASLLLALQWGGSKYGWANARIIVLFALVAATIVAFFWLQHKKQDAAMLPSRIFKQRSLLSGMWFSLCCNSAFSVFDYYVIKGVSATRSGILCLPVVSGLFSGLMLGGISVSLIGFYTPFMLATSVLSPIGAGLLTTLAVNGGLASPICYQLLLGFGSGIGFQAPQVAAQTVLSAPDVPMGIAAVIFAQNLGPAVFIPVAQTIFTARLAASLRTFAPGLRPGTAHTLDTTGLLDLRRLIQDASDLDAALRAYDSAITRTFALPVALSVVSLAGSLAMEWRSVKQKTS